MNKQVAMFQLHTEDGCSPAKQRKLSATDEQSSESHIIILESLERLESSCGRIKR